MTKRQYASMVALALIAGVMGGLISNQFFIGKPAFAEKQPTHQKVIRAEEFKLVSETGKTLGQLTSIDNHPMLILFDDYGIPRCDLSLGGLTLWKENMLMYALLTEGPSGGALLLFDNKQRLKLRAVLGSTKFKDQKTGVIQERPASSLVLFDENDSVIWSAP